MFSLPGPGLLHGTAQFCTGCCGNRTERSPGGCCGAARVRGGGPRRCRPPAARGTREAWVSPSDLPQMQKAGPAAEAEAEAEAGREELTEEGRVPTPCSPHPQIQQRSFATGLFIFLFFKRKKANSDSSCYPSTRGCSLYCFRCTEWQQEVDRAAMVTT